MALHIHKFMALVSHNILSKTLGALDFIKSFHQTICIFPFV